MSVETTPSANPWLQEPAYKVPRHPAQCDLILDGKEITSSDLSDLEAIFQEIFNLNK